MEFKAPPENVRSDGKVYQNYITWHAQGSAEKGIPEKQFSIRTSGPGSTPSPCPEMASGVVWNIEEIETGWLNWQKGQPKDYRPNPSISQPLPYPGQGFSENIKIPMALSADKTALWDQASAGSWKGFCQIAAVIAQQSPMNPHKLPIIAFTSSTLTSTGQNSTQVPNFRINGWIERPACFSLEAELKAPPPPPQIQQAQNNTWGQQAGSQQPQNEVQSSHETESNGFKNPTPQGAWNV